MEESCSTDQDAVFFNALDDFPFYDCLDCSTPNPPSSSGFRRRRSSSNHTPRQSSEDLIKIDSFHMKTNQESESVKLDSVGPQSCLSEDKFGDSAIASSIGECVTDSGESSMYRENGEDEQGFLFLLAELLIKAIGFQLNLIIGFVSFPFWAFYTSYMFVLNPFVTVKRGRDYMVAEIIKVCNLIIEAVAPNVSEWLKENHSFVKIAVRCAWALFWAAYVGSVLVGLLVSAFLGSGLVMRCVVEEPFHQKHSLNFDFTQNKPVAVVPIAPAWSSESSVDFGDSIVTEIPGLERVIFPNRKLQATLRLMVPESDYNRQLGMFQVRIEFMSANGKTLASLRQPCMLHFRSEPIRLLQVFIKIVPLVAGYWSESQTLNLKYQGFTEGEVPSAYLKVIIEQRAEFRPAGGIPEVYDAALLLESELPLLRSILWSWRKTLFVWLSMVLFMIELLFALVCCRTVVMPSMRPHNNAATAVARNTVTRRNQ